MCYHTHTQLHPHPSLIKVPSTSPLLPHLPVGWEPSTPLSVPRTRLPFLQILESSQTNHKAQTFNSSPLHSYNSLPSYPSLRLSTPQRLDIPSPHLIHSLLELNHRATSYSYHRAAVSETAASLTQPTDRHDPTQRNGSAPASFC